MHGVTIKITRLIFDGVQSVMRLGPHVEVHVGDSKKWGYYVPNRSFSVRYNKRSYGQTSLV